MRCSDCFAEIKERADGLYCDACGKKLEPLGVEDGAPVSEKTRTSWKYWLRWGLGGALLAALLPAAWFAAPHAQTLIASLEQSFGRTAALEPPVLIRRDDNYLVLEVETLASNEQEMHILDGDTCHLAQDAAMPPLTFRWGDASGQTGYSLSPQIPDNWTLQQLCPHGEGGALVQAASPDGAVLAALKPDGSLQWMRLLGDLDARSGQIFVEGDFILIGLHGTDREVFLLTAFDASGTTLWERTIADLKPNSRPAFVLSPMGDVHIAWNQAGLEDQITLELLSLTNENLLNFETSLPDRTISLSSLSTTDLAQTVLIEGQRGFSVQLVDADGREVWRRWIDAEAVPLGALSHKQKIFVAAHKNEAILFWSLDGTGRRSNPVELSLATDLQQAAFRLQNNAQAVVDLSAQDGLHARLVINLARLEEATSSDSADVTMELGEPFTAPEAPKEVQVPVEAPSANPEPALPDTQASIPIPASPPVPLPAPTPETPQAIPQLVEEDASLPTIEAVEPDIRTAICTFTCAETDDPTVTYPILQTIALWDRETVSDLPTRLRGGHAQLCRANGGTLASGTLPECRAQNSSDLN